MKSLFEWGLMICCPAIGFTKALQKASKEDNKTTVTQFIDTVPKVAKTASIALNLLVIALAVSGFFYIKNKFFGGRRAFRQIHGVF